MTTAAPERRQPPTRPKRPELITIMAKDVVRGDWIMPLDAHRDQSILIVASFLQGFDPEASQMAMQQADGTEILMPATAFLVWRGHTEMPPLAPPATVAASTPSNPAWELVVAHHEFLTENTDGEIPPLPEAPPEVEQPDALPPLPAEPPINATVTLEEVIAAQSA
jgi:hypothetical protein